MMITPEDRQRSIELFKNMEEGHLDAGIAAAEKFVKEQGAKKKRVRRKQRAALRKARRAGE